MLSGAGIGRAIEGCSRGGSSNGELRCGRGDCSLDTPSEPLLSESSSSKNVRNCWGLGYVNSSFASVDTSRAETSGDALLELGSSELAEWVW